ncbi:myb-like protein X [Vespula squamosa]|uniref:Myb-like protein X n=1 Tax=Vespula squamosa TaxID=30214 RepID=A0ABD2AAJ3_VESSQ
MQEFCPLCDKRGFRRRIKALQINFHEAIWACEGEECEWPFGHAEFIYIQRKVGNNWSCYWDDFNLKTVNNYVPVSTELALYTPPETPSTDSVLKEFLSDTQCSDDNVTINTINNSISANEVQSKKIGRFSDHDAYCLKNNESENIDNRPENINISVEKSDQNNDPSFYKDDKNNFCYENTQNIIGVENISKKILLKTEDHNLNENIINSEYRCSTNKMKSDLDNCVSKQKLLENNKDTSNVSNINKSHNNIESRSSTLDPKIQINKFIEESTTSSNLKITTVEINGLPVTVSYEAPVSSLIPITVSNINTNFITTECGTTSLSIDASSSTTAFNTIHKSTNKQLQSVSVGKQYKKFDFHAIKKELQPTVDSNGQNSNNKCSSNSSEGTSNIKSSINSLCSNSDQIQSQNSPETIKPCSSMNVNDNAETKGMTNEFLSLENLEMEPEINVENLLNDLLKSDDTSVNVNKNYEISNSDEDWIHSLLY